MDHIYIACLRMYFLNYLDSYRYAPVSQESAHAFGDLEEVADFKEESAHAFVDLEERESADSVADFKEESADDAVSVDLER